HRLPPGYQYIGSADELDADEEQDATGNDESDLPPPIPDEVRVRKKRPVAKTQPRTRVASQVSAGPPATEAAESHANLPGQNLPLPPEPAPALGVPGIITGPTDGEDGVQSYIVDEPFPQGPMDSDSWSCPPQGVDDCDCWGPLKKFLYFNQTN